jgi:hypothetical protein
MMIMMMMMTVMIDHRDHDVDSDDDTDDNDDCDHDCFIFCLSGDEATINLLIENKYDNDCDFDTSYLFWGETEDFITM